MNTLNLIILLVCINIVINVVLFVILSYNFGFIKKAIHVFDTVISETFKYIDKFDKAFFDKNKFKEGDVAFVGIITRVDDNDENKIKGKTDKK